jgi:carbon-monoxide dehydrogenase large subunit
MLHLTVVRSLVAHARIQDIDLDRARRAPGVITAVTAAELAGRTRPPRIIGLEGARVAQVPHPLLASGKVRYVGEPVVVLVAESPAQAQDAAELVRIDYDPLPAVVDPQHALRGEVLLHETLGENVLLRWSRTGGDVEGAFAAADRIVEGRFRIPRLIAAPIEPRGAIAAYDRGTDMLTVWSSSQDPHRPRANLSQILDRPDDRIRLIVPDVGGAFGTKGTPGPEVALAALLAIDLGRPIKWIEERRDNFLTAYQGRGLDAEVKMAVDRTGRITGVRARLTADLGAYLYTPTPQVPVTTGMLLTGAYEIPAADVELVGVATNKVPTGPYRGAGRPEACYLVERMMDLVARDLRRDPVDLRRQNAIAPHRFPYRTPLGFTYDSANYGRALDRCVELVEYDRWRAEQTKARAGGRLLGVGVALYVERAGGQLWESAAAAVGPSGRVVVRTGSNAHGQGHETTFAQIAADVLGVDVDAVAVVQGDSAAVPRGVGTFGSRSTTVGGSAMIVALNKIRAKATAIAAHLLEAAPEDIEWGEGRLFVRGSPDRTLPFAEVAAAAYQPWRLPPSIEMGLDASGYFALRGPVFPFGAYAAVVEVHRETGEVEILRLVAADDAGRIVNPLLAEGQVIGATVQGIGQALLEQAVYDEDGQPLTTTFAEYGLLRAAQVPPVTSALLETPSPLNPLGVKGLGEAGAIGAPSALANAVLDALAPLQVKHVDIPLTPAKLWKLIQAHPWGGR